MVFVPKRRRKAIFGQIRRQLGPIFHALAKQQECQIVEGQWMVDHVHGDSSEAPGGVGDWVLEGKERHRHRAAIGQGEELLRRTLLGARLRGVYSGFELEQVRQYIRARSRGW